MTIGYRLAWGVKRALGGYGNMTIDLAFIASFVYIMTYSEYLFISPNLLF